MENVDSCDGRDQGSCIFYGCCYAEVLVIAGDDNLLIGQCAHPDYVDERVNLDAGICETVNERADSKGYYNVNFCECGANTFKGIMIFLVVFLSILLVVCLIVIRIVCKSKKKKHKQV